MTCQVVGRFERWVLESIRDSDGTAPSIWRGFRDRMPDSIAVGPMRVALFKDALFRMLRFRFAQRTALERPLRCWSAEGGEHRVRAVKLVRLTDAGRAALDT